MVSTSELVLYSVLNYAPYALLALYAFRTSLRLRKTATLTIFFFSVFAEISLLIIGNNSDDPIPEICNAVSTLISTVLYFGAVKARWGRKLFHLFMVKNMANCNMVIAKGLEGIVFSQMASTPYRWSNSLCLMIVLLIDLPVFVWIIDHYFTKHIRETIGPRIWSRLWLVPFFFLIMWIDRFYYSGIGSLDLALKPKMILIMILYLSGQLMIYVCIAQMVINYNKTMLLQKENEQLARQTTQYEYLSSRIREVTALRHDMRHSLVVMKSYCDNRQYNELNAYLSQYASQFPHEGINYCENIMLNMLLVYYHGVCQKNEICYSVRLLIPKLLPFSDAETTVLFCNLLENAVDACKTVTDSNRNISIYGSVIQNRFIFHISNTFGTPVSIDEDGCLLSTKHTGRGIGTESVYAIVRKYDGDITINHKNQVFSVEFIIPHDE